MFLTPWDVQKSNAFMILYTWRCCFSAFCWFCRHWYHQNSLEPLVHTCYTPMHLAAVDVVSASVIHCISDDVMCIYRCCSICTIEAYCWKW